MVFAYHFNYLNNQPDSPLDPFPFAVLGEGHVGVPLFMALSGYLFAKLLDGRQIRYRPFLWNRVLRLAPMLLVVFLVVGVSRVIQGQSVATYLDQLANGFLLPTWPNGGWSITVEAHFYVILPLLLLLSARRPSLLLLVVLVALSGRFAVWWLTGEVQWIAYWTLAGCIDMFVFGIIGYRYRARMVGSHGAAAAIMLGIALFAYHFDSRGGFAHNADYPGGTAMWIYYPTFLGASFAGLIAWYDGSFRFRNTGVSGILAKIGACSYSIYLLHFFVVFWMRAWIEANIVELDNALLRFAVALLAFLCLVPMAYLSYRLIERPPLRYRRPYLGAPVPAPAAVPMPIAEPPVTAAAVSLAGTGPSSSGSRPRPPSISGAM